MHVLENRLQPCNSKYMETCNENINSKIQFDILGTSHNEKKCWKSVLQLLGIKFKQNSKTSEICQQKKKKSDMIKVNAHLCLIYSTKKFMGLIMRIHINSRTWRELNASFYIY